jgi:hypothetical protein
MLESLLALAPEPIATAKWPCATLQAPPLANEENPDATFSSPPPTVEKSAFASLLLPPATVENLPIFLVRAPQLLKLVRRKNCTTREKKPKKNDFRNTVSNEKIERATSK